MKTRILPASPEATREAIKLLRAGEAVALPTETVYGLAADALNVRAVLKVFAAKERPRFDPLIVHLPHQQWLTEVARVEGVATFIVQQLVGQFWPGPLTLVLPRRRIVPDVVTAGLRTVALRMSAHEVFADLIRTLDRPLAAPSANRFGRISSTSAEDVREELEHRIPLIIDAGRTPLGIESTVVAVRAGEIEILRRGPISAEQLQKIAPVRLAEATNRPKSPGQLASHYAPRTPLRTVRRASSFKAPKNARCGLLAWQTTDASRFAEVRRLSRKQDLAEAAANLFRQLRALDHCDLDLIVAEQVPDEGIGSAINDRLRRASTRAR